MYASLMLFLKIIKLLFATFDVDYDDDDFLSFVYKYLIN